MQTPFARRQLHRIIFLAALIFVAVCGAQPEKKPSYPPTLSGGAPCGSCTAPDTLSWKTVIPPENERGEPLVITGKIFKPDGTTPADGMVLICCAQPEGDVVIDL